MTASTLCHYTYAPIDAGAKDGTGHCLRAADGTLHAGRWYPEQGAFCYSSATPIAKHIVAYAVRRDGPAPDAEARQ